MGLVVLIGLIGALMDDDADAESPQAIGAAETSATVPPPTAEQPAPDPGFGDGTFLVGTDIAPGRYRTDGSRSCSWERQSDLTGDYDAMLAMDFPDGQAYVELLPTDVAFSSDGCGWWTPATSGGPDVSGGFEDGTYLVGSDLQPGTYRATGGRSCSWERLSDLTGDYDAMLAMDFPDGQAYVELLPTDVAFSSDGCGTWSRVG